MVPTATLYGRYSEEVRSQVSTLLGSWEVNQVEGLDNLESLQDCVVLVVDLSSRVGWASAAMKRMTEAHQAHLTFIILHTRCDELTQARLDYLLTLELSARLLQMPLDGSPESLEHLLQEEPVAATEHSVQSEISLNYRVAQGFTLELGYGGQEYSSSEGVLDMLRRVQAQHGRLSRGGLARVTHCLKEHLA